MSRVLIVEDELPLRRIITLNLARRGYDVAEADSVATAGEAVAAWNGTFDVILLDINLPDQTGWDVLRRLRQRAPATAQAAQDPQHSVTPRVIVISAVRPPQARLDAFRPDAVLIKPFPLQALLRLIERLVAAAPATELVGE